MRTHALVAIAAATMTFVTGESVAQDLAAAEATYKSSCRNCHGPTGKGMASFPRLAGQTEDYLVTRLEQHRAGERVGPNSALMQPHAADLSDEEIAGLAAYIAGTFE
jgi:cytochrome c553